ncbi:MAG TPA: zinc-binding alcohol dehydrogenase, partial [Spirochaetia bacterium]|nr:zinc-binding alcohol dehydrogenase [Spirochaetia bacterium]
MGRKIGHRIVGIGPGRVELEDFPVPSPRNGELLLETICTLISPGTERAFLLGLPNTPNSFPHYPGYSNVGRVVSIGTGVEGFVIGDLVASQTPHQSHAVIAVADAIGLRTGATPPEHAVFFNLGAVALQGVRKSRLEIGEPTLIIGLGLVGLLATGLSRLAGAYPLVTLDPVAERRGLSARVGADASIDPRSDGFETRIRECIGGSLPTVVIEATGAAEAVPLALKLAGEHGRVVLLASTRGVSDGIDFYTDIHRKGLTVIGAHNFVRPREDSSPRFWTVRDDWQVVLSLISSRRLDVSPLISH